jgi:hypothetical protein
MLTDIFDVQCEALSKPRPKRSYKLNYNVRLFPRRSILGKFTSEFAVGRKENNEQRED